MRALVMTAGFLAVAAHLHVAPAAAAIAALVEEEPGAIGRFAHAHRAELRGSEELRRRQRNRPQNAIQYQPGVRIPLPAIAILNPHQPAMDHCPEGEVVDLLQIAGRDGGALGQRREYTIEAFAIRNGCPQAGLLFAAAAPCLEAQLSGMLERYNLRLLGEGDEIVVAVNVVCGVLGKLAAADGVGKIQAEDAAAQVKLVLRHDVVRVHYLSITGFAKVAGYFHSCVPIREFLCAP